MNETDHPHQDLPSMDALVAFEVSARRLSFKAAASALGVSASALSRRIQNLEDHLGEPLFLRVNPGLELTEAGARFLETTERVLRELRAGVRSLTVSRMTAPLRVSALESFSAHWLVPRLPDFERRHPGLSVELEATLRYADFDRDPVDVAIRFGTGPWDELHSEPLVDLAYFPVCHPSLLDAEPPLRTPADLAEHCWIHVSQVRKAWADWAFKTGHPNLRGARDVEYDHVDIALSAAESRQGVALSSPILCADRIADGRLCVPFDLPVPSSETYHLVCKPKGLQDPRIVALRDWLVDSLA